MKPQIRFSLKKSKSELIASLYDNFYHIIINKTNVEDTANNQDRPVLALCRLFEILTAESGKRT